MFPYLLRFVIVIIVSVTVSVTITECTPFNEDLSFGRIVNGTETTIREHPYQVSLQTANRGQHYCGGSIIASDIVVTAAHCVEGVQASSIQVRLGSTSCTEGGQVVKVKDLKYHEKYNRRHMKYDVAVLKLAQPVKQSSKIRYIKLATTLPKTGTPAVVSGWGTTCSQDCDASEILMEVEVNFLNQKECASNDFLYGDKIADTMICAYTETKDSCQGDSGGPLVADGKLVGVVSWGQGCALKGYPGVYSNIVVLRKWILETSKKF